MSLVLPALSIKWQQANEGETIQTVGIAMAGIAKSIGTPSSTLHFSLAAFHAIVKTIVFQGTRASPRRRLYNLITRQLMRLMTDNRKKVIRLMLSAVGAAIGISITLSFVHASASPFLLASLGGSTVFLFGLTQAPAAQPRALFGGHLGGALIGVLCFQLFGDALWVYTVALALTLVFMLATHTVHPPAGANPLIMVHAHANLSALWQPVGIGILILALVAAVWTRIIPGMVHYPIRWFDKSPPDRFAAWIE